MWTKYGFLCGAGGFSERLGDRELWFSTNFSSRHEVYEGTTGNARGGRETFVTQDAIRIHASNLPKGRVNRDLGGVHLVIEQASASRIVVQLLGPTAYSHQICSNSKCVRHVDTPEGKRRCT